MCSAPPKAGLIQADFVVGVVGIGLASLHVIINCFVIILDIESFFSGRIVFFAFRASRCEHSDEHDEEQKTAAAHEFSGISTGRNPLLYLPLESSIGLTGRASQLSSYVACYQLFHVPVPGFLNGIGPEADWQGAVI